MGRNKFGIKFISPYGKTSAPVYFIKKTDRDKVVKDLVRKGANPFSLKKITRKK